MKIKIFGVVSLCLGLPVLLSSQVKLNGYLSAEFLKGQSQSEFQNGSFQNVKGGLLFSGVVGSGFDYALEVRLQDVSRFQIEQALLGFAASQAFNFRLGLYLVPFGQYNRSNRPHQTAMIRFPLILEDIYPESWRDIGLLVEGRTGNILYSAYVGNGLAETPDLASGQQFKDNNSNKGLGAHLGFTIGGEFEAGFSYYRGKYDDANARNLTLLGFDASWKTDALQVLGEYAQARLENPAPYARGEVKGYFIQVSLSPGKWHPFACYQKSQYEDPFHGFGGGASSGAPPGIFKDRTRWALGVDLLLSSTLLFKAEYDINRDKNQSLKNNLFSAQIALSF